jgi:ankyrin repeat protein
VIATDKIKELGMLSSRFKAWLMVLFGPPNEGRFWLAMLVIFLLLYVLLSQLKSPEAIMGYGLVQSAYVNDVEEINWLLEQGANPNHRDKRGNTAIDVALAVGSQEAVEILLNAGAKSTRSRWVKDLERYKHQPQWYRRWRKGMHDSLAQGGNK